MYSLYSNHLNRIFYADNELRSLTKRKLLSSLVACQLILLYLLPDGSRVNRLWKGRVLSVNILQALPKHLTSPISLMLHHVYQ